MDFITQITLGAAVGQATMHRELGNKAAAWGLLAGALPDLDILAYPLMDSISQLAWHRGISHGLPLALALSPALGYMIARVHRRRVSVEKASLFVFLALVTHILLDVFTVYGTGVFEPFSSKRVAFNNLFIIDPLYTLPLLIGVIASLFPGEPRAKMFRNSAGVIVSSAYVLLTLLLKFATLPAFERALEQQNILYTRMMTTPTPFNSLLWRALVEDEEGYWIAYRSVFDKRSDVRFWRVPRNEKLLTGFEEERALRMLLWFSDGWYSVSRDERGLLFHDLRFGEVDTAVPSNSFGSGDPRNLSYMFTFKLVPTGAATPEQLSLQREDIGLPRFASIMQILGKRILGKR